MIAITIEMDPNYANELMQSDRQQHPKSVHCFRTVFFGIRWKKARFQDVTHEANNSFDLILWS